MLLARAFVRRSNFVLPLLALVSASCSSSLPSEQETTPQAPARVASHVRELPGVPCSLDFETRAAFLGDAQNTIGTLGNTEGVTHLWPLAQYSEPGAERFDWSVSALYLPARPDETNEARLQRAFDVWSQESHVTPEQPSLQIVSEQARVWTFNRDASWTTKLRVELVGAYVLTVDANYGPSGEAPSSRFVASLSCRVPASEAPRFAVQSLSALNLDVDLPDGVATVAASSTDDADVNATPVRPIARVGREVQRFEGTVGRLSFHAHVFEYARVQNLSSRGALVRYLHAKYGEHAEVRPSCALNGRASLLSTSVDATNASKRYTSVLELHDLLVELDVDAPAELSSEEWMTLAYFLYQPRTATPNVDGEDATDMVAGTTIAANEVRSTLRATRGRLAACFRNTNLASTYLLLVNRGGDVTDVMEGGDGARESRADACAADVLSDLSFADSYVARSAYLRCSRSGCEPASGYLAEELAECSH